MSKSRRAFIDAFLKHYEEVLKDCCGEDQFGMDTVCNMLIEHPISSYRYDDLCRAIRGIFLPQVEKN